MKQSKPYAELVTQAEEATKAIKDPELRRVAFERVLDDLLAGGGTATESQARSKKPPQRARTAAKAKSSRGPKGYIRELFDDGFFKKPKTISQVKAELGNRGHHIALTSLSGPLQSLCKDRVLRRHKAKAGEKGTKVTYNYSEW
ncbi:MAG TPA: hypothetical protein VD788_09430 [Candidatus Polarisedimenticolaceae bacterium]|nr:hypothetical protein [Candidatus Polarisedimenticolaceae bacterium]